MQETHESGGGEEKGQLATITHKLSLPPWKPQDSVKHENCCCKCATECTVRKVMTACQGQTAKGAWNLLKTAFARAFQFHCLKAMFLTTEMFFFSLKRLESLSAAPQATLTSLLCSPNFPCAQYLDMRTLNHELIEFCV